MMNSHIGISSSDKENLGTLPNSSMRVESMNKPGNSASFPIAARKTSTAQQLVSALEEIVEALKAKNTPEVVNFRLVERTKITNFLKKYLDS